MAASESRELVVVDRWTGEQLDVLAAPTDQLAGFLANLAELREQLRQAERLVDAELLERMDKALSWTHRLPIRDGAQVELNAPSPNAGTTTYDPLKLDEDLSAMVARGELSFEALEEVVPRTVTVTAKGRDTERLEKYAARNGYEVKVDVKATVGGVNKLGKLQDPGIDCAIERAKVTTPNLNRSVKVKVIDKEAAKRR